MKGTGFLTAFAVTSGCIGLCLLYQLDVGYIVAMVILCLCFLPRWLKNHEKNRNEKKRLSDAQTYMEQLLYAFMRHGSLATALQEVIVLFPDGSMHEILTKAIHLIMHDFEQEDALRSGLLVIEEEYENERLSSIHRFLYKVEMVGGSYDGVTSLMLKDLSVWQKRMDSFQSDCKQAKNNVSIAIGVALFICMVTNYILPDRIDMAGNQVRMISTVILLAALMLIYTKADKRLSVNWLKHGYPKNSQSMRKRYERLLSYDEKKEQKSSILMAAVPFLIGVIAACKANLPLAFLTIFLMIFLLHQHKIGHYLAKKNLIREIGKAFPQWLMELSLLLQIDNVQVSIAKTMKHAPEVLKPALVKFQDAILKNPESVQPYLDFLKEFSLPQVQSAMKMLYAVSAGTGGNESEQLTELIDRNQTLMNQAEELINEDALAGMYVLFLVPALAGAVKLMIDMTIFLLTFFTQVSVG